MRVDSSGLSADDWALRYSLEDELLEIYRKEEAYWRQRGPFNWVLFGDAIRLTFRPLPMAARVDAPSHCFGMAKGLPAENRALLAPFEEVEVAAIIKGMNPSSPPGPGGLPVRFFHTFWHSIKGEIMSLSCEFEQGVSDLSRLNFGIISLIPKVPGASDIRTAININGVLGPYFPTTHGVRQGDLFSPFLFNLVVDALAAMLDRAKRAEHLSSLCQHLPLAGGITHLQYADDMILMVEGSSHDITHLKFLLLCFLRFPA
ncbi:ABC transporter G family member 37 [Hordeum vulgare]|nr:ABC transporter G family member 37 [Hordeum vulgare]